MRHIKQFFKFLSELQQIRRLCRGKFSDYKSILDERSKLAALNNKTNKIEGASAKKATEVTKDNKNESQETKVLMKKTDEKSVKEKDEISMLNTDNKNKSAVETTWNSFIKEILHDENEPTSSLDHGKENSGVKTKDDSKVVVMHEDEQNIKETKKMKEKEDMFEKIRKALYGEENEVVKSSKSASPVNPDLNNKEVPIKKENSRNDIDTDLPPNNKGSLSNWHFTKNPVSNVNTDLNSKEKEVVDTKETVRKGENDVNLKPNGWLSKWYNNELKKVEQYKTPNNENSRQQSKTGDEDFWESKLVSSETTSVKSQEISTKKDATKHDSKLPESKSGWFSKWYSNSENEEKLNPEPKDNITLDISAKTPVQKEKPKPAVATLTPSKREAITKLETVNSDSGSSFFGPKSKTKETDLQEVPEKLKINVNKRRNTTKKRSNQLKSSGKNVPKKKKPRLLIDTKKNPSASYAKHLQGVNPHMLKNIGIRGSNPYLQKHRQHSSKNSDEIESAEKATKASAVKAKNEEVNSKTKTSKTDKLMLDSLFDDFDLNPSKPSPLEKKEKEEEAENDEHISEAEEKKPETPKLNTFIDPQLKSIGVENIYETKNKSTTQDRSSPAVNSFQKRESYQRSPYENDKKFQAVHSKEQTDNKTKEDSAESRKKQNYNEKAEKDENNFQREEKYEQNMSARSHNQNYNNYNHHQYNGSNRPFEKDYNYSKEYFPTKPYYTNTLSYNYPSMQRQMSNNNYYPHPHSNPNNNTTGHQYAGTYNNYQYNSGQSYNMSNANYNYQANQYPNYNTSNNSINYNPSASTSGYQYHNNHNVVANREENKNRKIDNIVQKNIQTQMANKYKQSSNSQEKSLSSSNKNNQQNQKFTSHAESLLEVAKKSRTSEDVNENFKK